MDSYAERLALAMNEQRMHPQTLANHLDLSLQAVRKVLGGHSAAFSVPNHFKAAEILRVDAYWLATGEGKMVSEKVWPFVLTTPEQIQKLNSDNLEIVQNLALQLLKAQSLPIASIPSTPNTEVKGSRVGETIKIPKDRSRGGKSDPNEGAPKKSARGG